MTIRLKQDWNGHKKNAELDLLDWEERALVAGGAADQIAPHKTRSFDPVPAEKAGPASQAATDAEQAETEGDAEPDEDTKKANLRQAIADLGGDNPHPNTGLAKLEEIHADLMAKRDEERFADEE